MVTPVFLIEKYCYFQHSFEAAVIETLLQEKNSSVCLLEMTNSATDFFAQLRNFFPELFQLMTTLIDRGALLSNAKPIEVITSYLSGKKEEIPYNTAVCLDQGQMLLRSNDPDIKESDVPGSDLIGTLKRLGVQPETFLLFLFLDLSQTTGTDIKRPYSDKAGLTIGKEQTVTQSIQASMRERQLLCDDAQTVIWIMFKTLYQEINPHREHFDLESVFYWMIANEAKPTESKIVMRAYQGIDREIEAIVWSNIRSAKKNYKDYEEKLQKSFSLSAWNNYEIESEMNEAETVLNDYVNDRCKDFNIDRLTLPLPTGERIKLLIKETIRLIQEMRQPKGVELNCEVYQEQQAEKEQEQEQQIKEIVKSIFDKTLSFTFNLEIYDDSDKLEIIFSERGKKKYYYSSEYQQLTLKGCQHLSLPPLLIRPQDFYPLKSTPSNMANDPLQALKPIKVLLLRMTNYNDLQFLACTTAGAEFFYHQITNLNSQGNKVTYALIGIDSNLLLTSKNMSSQQKSQLDNSEQIQEYVTFASFLNGQMNNSQLLSQIIRKYGWTKENYLCLADAIAKIHVSRCPMNLHNIASLEKLCGWKKQETLFSFFQQNKNREQETLQSREPSILLSPDSQLPTRASHTLFKSKPSSVLPECVLGKKTTSRIDI